MNNKLSQLKHSYYLYIIIWVKYFTFKKLFNLFFNLYECKTKKIIIKSVPFIVNIDVSNICVLNCPLCPTGRRDPQKKGIMNFEKFKDIFDKVKDYLFDVKLYNWGEPFLCKDIFKIVDYCHKNNVGVRLHSNLNYYTEEILENIVKHKIDYLHLSIDGYSQEAYEYYRRSGDIGKVFKGLEKIQEYKKKLKNRFPIIHWGYLINNKNKDEIEKASNYAKKIGVEVFEAFNMCLFTTLGDRYSREKYTEFLSEVSEENKCSSWESEGACSFPWIELVINPNSSFYPCCIMYEDGDIFGWFNNSQDIHQILNSEILVESRKLFKNKNYKTKCATPCNRCAWCIKL